MYEAVELLDLDGSWIGCAIKKKGVPKLESVNIYGVSADEQRELDQHLKELNEAVVLRDYWPTPDDPEVQALIDNPEFEPIQYEDVEVPDWENSDVAYLLDPEGNTQIGTDGNPVINYLASTIVNKIERQPVRTQSKTRIDAACEIVAHQRAGI